MPVDVALFRWINQWPHAPWSDRLILAVNRLGETWVALGFTFLVFLALRGRAKRIAGLALAALVLIAPSMSFLKGWVARPRPELTVPDAVFVTHRLSHESFPSGHASSSAAIACALSVAAPRWRWLWWLGAGFIAGSRIYLGLHFPSDVLAGMLIGAVSAAMVMRLGRRWLSP